MNNLKKLLVPLFIFILTLFSILVYPGYSVFELDQRMYIPSVYKILDISLYNNDILLKYSQSDMGLFDEIFAFLLKEININIFLLFFLLTIIFRFIYFYSIYRISLYFTSNKSFSLFASLIFLIPLPTFGNVMNTMDLELIPRMISMSLCLFSLYLYLEKKVLASALLLGSTLIIHPVSTFPFLAFYYADLFFSSLKNKNLFSFKKLILFIAPLLWLVFPLLTIKGSSFGLFRIIDPAWKNIIIFRNPGAFITNRFTKSWILIPFLQVIPSVILFWISMADLKSFFSNAKKRHLYLLFIVPAVLFVVYFFMADLLMVHFFTQIQITRGLILWKFIIPIIFSFYAFNYIKENPDDKIYNFSMLGIVTSYLINENILFVFFPLFLFIYLRRKLSKSNYYPIILNKNFWLYKIFLASLALISILVFLLGKLNIFILYFALIFGIAFISSWYISYYKKFKLTNTKLGLVIFAMLAIIIFSIPSFSMHPVYYKDKSFLEMCNWIKNNTSRDDVFMTEPFYDGGHHIRFECQRNIFYTWKDGAQATIDRDFAFEWQHRFNIIKSIEENNNNLLNLVKGEKVDYVVSLKKLNLGIELVFSNEKYYVYKLVV